MGRYHHGDLRKALLEASEAILERDGIAALTLRAAAREAGVSHAAPIHHFGDLSGLLSELAASGFIRFRDHVKAQTANAPAGPSARLRALTRGYVEFARSHRGLFQLMFRSERLDWSLASLASAGASAFALLTPHADDAPDATSAYRGLVAGIARWSFAHGMAMLLIDGRLEAIAASIPGANAEALIEEMLKCSVEADPTREG